MCCCALFAATASAAEEVTMTSEYLELKPSCAARLEKLWTQYYSKTAAGKECQATLQQALTVASVDDLPKCPPVNETTACFKLAEDPWYAYIVRCELFHYNVPCSSGGSAEGEAEAGGGADACQINASEGGPAADPNFKPGCFPMFRTTHDFHEWLDGDLVLTANAASSLMGSFSRVLAGAAMVLLAAVLGN